MKGVEEYKRALDAAIWYNGLAPIILSWSTLGAENGIIRYPYNYCAPSDCDRFDVAQLQLVWMMGVLMFGDYGTSPRYGWITDIKGFQEWILEITKLSRRDAIYV